MLELVFLYLLWFLQGSFPAQIIKHYEQLPDGFFPAAGTLVPKPAPL